MAEQVSNTTTDHDTIRSWAEARGGRPAQVASTAGEDQTGIIRIDFPGFSGEGKLQEISWDEWFQKFDEAGLALVYEETTAGGERSNFNKLIGRETAAARERGEKTSRRAARGSSAGAKPRKQASLARGSREAGRAAAARTVRGAKAGGAKAGAAKSRGAKAVKKKAPAKRTGTAARPGGRKGGGRGPGRGSR